MRDETWKRKIIFDIRGGNFRPNEKVDHDLSIRVSRLSSMSIETFF